MSEQVPREIRELTNKGLRHAFEIGVFGQAMAQVKASFYGVQPPDDPGFRICLMNNDLNVSKFSFSSFRFNQIN